MKKQTIIAVLFLLTGWLGKVCAQNKEFTDTLVLKLNSEMKVMVTAREILTVQKKVKYDTVFAKIVSQLAVLKDTIPAIPVPQEIVYTFLFGENKSEINVKALNAQIGFRFSGKEKVESTEYLYKLSVNGLPNQKIEVYSNDFKRLLELDGKQLSEWTDSAIMALKPKSGKRYSRYAAFDLNGSKLETNKFQFRKYGVDFLELSGNAGVGLIQSTIVPEFNLQLGFSFENKSRIVSTFSIFSTYYAFVNAENNYKTSMNIFLNVGYSVYPKIWGSKKLTLGLQAGYLTKRKGEFFDKDTWRFATVFPAGKVSLSVGAFVSNGFKSAMPLIGVRFHFPDF